MRITMYIHIEDLENLSLALMPDDVIVKSVRVLNQANEEYVQVSLTYDEYVKCTDLGIFEELLSL
jgi:hypothetical protein